MATSSFARADKPLVATTTSLIGDVVRQVAGESLDILVMMPPGTDPHHFEPSARLLVRISGAAIIFVNGFGLESFMDRTLSALPRTQDAGPAMVTVSEGISPHDSADDSPCEPHSHNALHKHDPHVWTDPLMVETWVDNISAAFCRHFPEHATLFQSNAQTYRQQLRDLDQWIKETVSSIPEERRLLVTDHHMLGYFAKRYGFKQAGMILPNYSTAAEPSAKELAALHRLMLELATQVIFIGMSSSPAMAEQLAHDTGAKVVRIYSGALGTAGSGVETYVDYMKYNVRAITEALK